VEAFFVLRSVSSCFVKLVFIVHRTIIITNTSVIKTDRTYITKLMALIPYII